MSEEEEELTSVSLSDLFNWTSPRGRVSERLFASPQSDSSETYVEPEVEPEPEPEPEPDSSSVTTTSSTMTTGNSSGGPKEPRVGGVKHNIAWTGTGAPDDPTSPFSATCYRAELKSFSDFKSINALERSITSPLPDAYKFCLASENGATWIESWDKFAEISNAAGGQR